MVRKEDALPWLYYVFNVEKGFNKKKLAIAIQSDGQFDGFKLAGD